MIPSATPQSLHQTPDSAGFFGAYGGIFVPPDLEAPLAEIRQAYEIVSRSHDFIEELRRIRRHFQGRPTPVYHAARLSKKLGRTQIYLKREDLNHTGAHKLNHCMGEGLLARYMGKKKLIAETGAGQHGVALATAAAYFGLECDIYMGEVDIAKQAPNVARMNILGARVIPATHGLRTLKEAVDSALMAYMQDPVNQIYCIGSVVGPHPFPMMVRDFQQVVGIEAREQIIEMTGNLPDIVTACVGGGSNAMGIFAGFIDDPVELHGVEPLGKGTTLGEHSATMTYGMEGVIHGFRCYLLQDDEGRTRTRPLDRQRPRLPGRRPRTLPSQGHRPRQLLHRHRQGSRRGVLCAQPQRRASSRRWKAPMPLPTPCASPAKTPNSRAPCWSISAAAATRTWIT